ncbi:lysylphosphatidylglycerol synthase transmembrane domain-containing protein [Polluticaenibacter yanchengensis]|uniref:Lysylphosphatidylglycerol synthase transmembrane domain-containing protein n=1 Tax=Polluticaenibacter yanchengensis TaxID=3014562 RepID=A0ABT4ULY5_9BACT|nr:lysylphosphatidylglycerol synthase transmembrane domain-containing protein [Chitinophagaceae bacterium LY-5]
MNKAKSLIKYILIFGFGIFIIWWIGKDLTDEQKTLFYSSLKEANLWFILPISLLALLSHFLRAKRWGLMLHQMKYTPKTMNLFLVTLIGYLANLGIPRLGEILKCTYLNKYEKIPADKLVGTIVVERIFDMVCFAAVFGLAILVEFKTVLHFINNGLFKNSGNSVSKLIILGFIALTGFLLLKYFFKKFPTNKFVIKANEILKNIQAGLLSIINLKTRGLFLIYTICIWFLYWIQIYIGYQFLDSLSHLSIGSSFAVFAISTIAIAVTPGGIGLYQLFVMQVLLLYGISESSGLAFGWIMWGLSTIILIISGLISLFVLPKVNKKINLQPQIL